MLKNNVIILRHSDIKNIGSISFQSYHLFSNDCYGDSGSIGLTVSPYSPDEVETAANGVPPSLLVFNFLVSESNPYFINSKPSLTE